MPLKLNVGLSKKVGLPRYGSLGAACHVEIELAGDVLMNDPLAFQRHVRNAYTACRQAVELELARRNRTDANQQRPTAGAAVINRRTHGDIAANRSQANRRLDSGEHATNGHGRHGDARGGHQEPRNNNSDSLDDIDHGEVDNGEEVHEEDQREESQGETSRGEPSRDEASQRADQDSETLSFCPASYRQHAYIRRLAAEIRWPGTRPLDAFVRRMFDKPLAELSSHDASQLIDALKAIAAREEGTPATSSKAEA